MWNFVSSCILILLLCLLAYHQREKIIPRLPQRVHEMFPRLGNYSRLSTFAEQAEAGMSSAAFDINANITEGDSRMGLDERGTQEVRDIMRRERVNFDQARLIRQNRILAANGIDPSGMPLDAKAVTRL